MDCLILTPFLLRTKPLHGKTGVLYPVASKNNDTITTATIMLMYLFL